MQGLVLQNSTDCTNWQCLCTSLLSLDRREVERFLTITITELLSIQSIILSACHPWALALTDQ